MGSPACFGSLMRGTLSRVRSIPVLGELLMPQPILRHIARRAVQVAIVAAGILVVLLVFSRQAHAATSAPSAVASAPSPSAPAPVTSAAAPATSAATPVVSAATSAATPAPSAT